MSKIYLSSKGFKPADAGAARILNRQLELMKEKDTILFPEGTYYLMEPIKVHNKGIRLEGGEDTRLRVYHKETGFLFTRDRGTYWTEMERIVLSNNKGDHENFEQHGIESSVQIKIRDCEVHAFHGHGIYLWASIGGERPVSNCAFSRLDSVLVASCKGDGLRIKGADSSAVNVYHTDIRDCVGVGFHDDSFLGCFFFGCMAHNNWKGNYRAMGSVSMATFTGCYSEMGENPDAFAGSAQVFNGFFHSDKLIFADHAAGYFNGRIYSHHNEHLIKDLIV